MNRIQHLAQVVGTLCAVTAAAAIWASPSPGYAATIHPLARLRPRHWYQAPNTKMQAVFPAHPPPGRPWDVVNAWSGGVFNTRDHELVLWGGGHHDYAGNEIYAFNVDTLKWRRLTDPSPVKPCVPYYPDGRPSATHTYNTLAYAAVTNQMVQVAGGAYSSGCKNMSAGINFHTNLFNFSSSTWTRGPNRPAIGGIWGEIVAYDPATKKVWAQGYGSQNRLASYNPVAKKWRVFGSGNYLRMYSTGAIDPQRHLLVSVGGYGHKPQIVVWNLQHPNHDYHPHTTGDKRIESAEAPGFAYDPVIGKFVGWMRGGSVFVLNPANWKWTKVAPAPDNSVVPTAPNRNGTYGRFRYVPSKNVFILYNRTKDNVFFYKLTDRSGKPAIH